MISNILGANIFCAKIDEKSIIDEYLENVDVRSYTKSNLDHTSKIYGDWNCQVSTGIKESLIDFNTDLWAPKMINIFQKYIKEYVVTLKNVHSKEQVDLKLTDFWANYYEPANSQECHTHHGSGNVLSFNYIYKQPKDSSKFIIHSVLPEMNYVGQDGQIDTSYHQWDLEAEEGTLIIFPSWLPHRVSGNDSTSPRITFSGNVALDREKMKENDV